jgi:hypothetical protein
MLQKLGGVSSAEAVSLGYKQLTYVPSLFTIDRLNLRGWKKYPTIVKFYHKPGKIS